MPLLGQPHARPVEKLSGLRRMMPFLMPRRNDSVVYFEQHIDVGATLDWLATEDSGTGPKVTFFIVILGAFVRTLASRPRLNRFIAGLRTWQRQDITLSFAVKKRFADDAGLTTVKVRFAPDDDLQEIARKVDEAIAIGRGSKQTSSEKEVALITRMPRFAIRLLLWFNGLMEYFNVAPTAMLEADPLHASAFLANLGSVGIDAPYHHLFEHGTCSIFATIGRIHKAPIVDADGALAVGRMVTLRYSYDERIADGFYAARALEMLSRHVADAEGTWGSSTDEESAG